MPPLKNTKNQKTKKPLSKVEIGGKFLSVRYGFYQKTPFPNRVLNE